MSPLRDGRTTLNRKCRSNLNMVMDNLSALKTLADLAGEGHWLYQKDRGYTRHDGPVTEEMLPSHLDGSQPLGINVARKGAKTRFLIFDFDDHGGEVDSSVMERRVGVVAGVLETNQIPYFVVRSGGGRGYHIWIIFDREYGSAHVLDSGKRLLNSANKLLHQVWPEEEFTVGTGGLFAHRENGHVKHEIEIFPKGEAARYNIALPLARQSVAMSVKRVDENGFVDFEEGSEIKIAYAKGKKPGSKTSAQSEDIDYDAAFDAFIQSYDVENYDQWGGAALCLIAAFEAKNGPRSDWARERWTAWSKTGQSYRQGDEKKWDKVGKARYSPISFWLIAKDNGYNGALPFNQTETRKLTALSFLDDVRLLRDEVGIAYAQIGDRDFVPVKSEAFSRHVTLGLHRDKGLVPDETMVRSVVNFADALASETQREAVWLRFGQVGEVRYLFLADDDCTIVEIDRSGWRIADDAPAVFRQGDCLPMPKPQHGKLSELTDFLNVDDDEMAFLLAWMVTAIYFPGQACPIALLDGPAGSGKSSALRTIIETIDPKVGAQAGEPKSEDDLFAAAYNAGTVSGDNFSSIAKISDPLCRLSTGGGIRKRKLYTDLDSVSMTAKRPILIAGIDPTFYASDLSERIVRIRLQRPNEYLNDMQFEAMLEEKTARFTGAILDLVSLCIREADGIDYSGSRFATYCRVGEVVARKLGRAPGWFIEASEGKRSEELTDLEYSDSVLEFLVRYIATSGMHKGRWEANSKQLWEEMQEQIELGHLVVAKDDVPRSPKGMGSRVERAVPMLTQHNVTVSRGARRSFVFEWDVDEAAAIKAVLELFKKQNAF